MKYNIAIKNIEVWELTYNNYQDKMSGAKKQSSEYSVH